MERLLVVSSSPHIHAPLDTRKIMAWVLIALAPSGIAGIYFFGLRAAIVMAVSVVACVASEKIWETVGKKPDTIGDLSAAVTGLLLAYNVPSTIPFWMVAVGGVFAIIVIKQCFGGIGCNIVNPALAGRAMMLASWPVPMTTWAVDGVSTATPLAMIKAGATSAVSGASQAAAGGAQASLPSLCSVFIGNIGGCIGETSAIALIIGFLILVWKEIIDWRIPVVYIATVAILSVLFGRGVSPLYEICCGGLFLGAIFMATDYTTSPITKTGHVIFALGCGFLTALIRKFGGYPEGVSYSILIMNITVPLIDRLLTRHIFGEVKKRG